MKRLISGRRSQVALTAALALLMVGGLSSAAQATNARSSSDPELCKDGGWQNLTTSTGAPFANQGDCVSYAVHGGVLHPKASLVLTVSDCQLAGEDPVFGRVLRCTAVVAGSGLKPAADAIFCDPGPGAGCLTIGSAVAPDGTLNFGGPGLFCVEGKVLSASSTTAADNPITDTATCSL
jgi:hypothetical protein